MSAADKIVDTLHDRDGSGSWFGITVASVVLLVLGAYVFHWVDEKLSVSEHNAELKAVIDQSNANEELFKKQMLLRDKDLEASIAEVKWARWYIANQKKKQAELEAQNEELTTLLNSRYTSDLLR